jgi:hypothetical protein
MKKPCRIVVICLLIVFSVAIIFTVAMLHDHRQRAQADQLLSVLRQIRVGSTSRATVVSMTTPFRHNVDALPSGDQLRFVFYNKWLHRLGLAPHVEVRVAISFDGGIVVDKRAYVIVSTTGCAAEVVERKRGAKVPGGLLIPPPHNVVAWPDASGRNVTRIRIENDDTYGEAQRHNDWTFNLGCMTKIGPGCRDARVMLPNAALSPTEGKPQSGSAAAESH